MANISELFADVEDTNDCDTVVYVSLKDSVIKVVGHQGRKPEHVPEPVFLYRVLVEAANAIAQSVQNES